MRCFALELRKCVRNTEGTRQELRLHLDWGGAALKLSGGSTGLANELSVRGEVKGRNKEELRKIELEKVKMEREGRGMEGRVLDSRLNRFSPSNFAGLAHFLSGSFVEEKPVGVGARINREKEQSPVFPFALPLADPLPLSVSPLSLSPPTLAFSTC